LVCPWTFGGHVDHRLTRLAAERLGQHGRAHWLWYYADYPYILKEEAVLEQLKREGVVDRIFTVSEGGLAAWQEAVAAHTTQISTFWPNQEAMRAAIRSYSELMGGVFLLKK
jgi:LmbE family N-acetylglucosaminyl deacetylase